MNQHKNLFSTFYFLLSARGGQSLIEVLIALLVGVIMIGAGATIIAPVLRSNTQTLKSQVGTSLGKELLDNVSVWSQGDWNGLLALSTTSANRYYLTTSTSPFSSVSGSENLQVGTTTYTRYFYVDDVFRDAGNLIVTSGGNSDPSTKRVTVVYRWPQSATNTLSTYLTRSRTSYIYSQTDWFGGPGQDTPVTSTNSKFSTSTKIYYTTSTGSIQIQFQ
ncbi:MAG: hypothetical protein FJY98_02230 [Candidatus Liptonbacteria bacterium]|nr:hypothetical protein [Candidatus Liptonbacteria bacterium]